MNQRKNYLLIPSLLIVLVGTLMPGNGQIAGQYLDKVAHFLMFGFLGFNVARSFYSKRLLFFTLCIGLGFLTEIAQIYIPGRNFEWWDVFADALGVFVGFWVYKSL